MLGALFLVVQHLLRQALVLGFVMSPRMRARNGAIFQLAARDPHQHLRRRAQNMRVPHAQKIQIRRRIHPAQGAVHVKGLDRRGEIQPLRKHDLKNVSGGNVFLGALDGSDEFLPAGSGVNFQFALSRPRGFAPVRRPQSRSQFLFQRCNVLRSPVIGLARTFARHIGGGNDVDLVAQMIERQQAIEKHQYAVGQGKIIFGVFADIFQLPHCVVGEVADRARGERRQPGHGGGTMLPQQFLDDLNRVPLALLLLLAAPHRSMSPPRARTCM